VKSIGDLVGNYRLLSYALNAYGLGDQINAKGLITKVLEGGVSNPKSLANTLPDSRWTPKPVSIEPAAQQSQPTEELAKSEEIAAKLADVFARVIRAASSQTLGSIEGARDAIANRLAAIGQPLDSLIVKQTGVNTNANTNGNADSAEDGATGETWRSAQGASEWGGSNDALFRRGAARDRNF
jgi:hypothetical protein